MKDMGKATSEEIRKFEGADNPLDVLLYQSLQLARDFCWISTRIKNENFTKIIHDRIKYIELLYRKFDSLTSETDVKQIIADTCYAQDHRDELNMILFGIGERLNTTYTNDIPCRSMEWEAYTRGKDSEPFKHLIDLQNIATSEEFIHLSYSDLCGMMDILMGTPCDSPDPEKISNLISAHSLTANDVAYMISYRKKIGLE